MKTINLDHKDNYRIIAISDVHANWEHLDGLLKKIDLQTDDILIILGDFINRGKNSCKTLKYIQQLSLRKNTYILKGNHEFFIHTFVNQKDSIEALHEFLKRNDYETLLGTILKESGEDIYEMTATQMMTFFEHHEALNYIRSLPIYLTIDDYIFVHGGYESHFEEESDFLKYDFYNKLGGQQEKKVVVGHWPACNLRFHELSNRPYYNHEKNIIFIDGALGVKQTGELTAFIIQKKEGQLTYEDIQYNDFESRKIIQAHVFEHEPLIYVNFPYYDFELLTPGDEMSLCKHIHTGIKFHVFNGLLLESDEGFSLKTNYINNFLDVNVGEDVLICERYDDCTLVKYKGEFGWVLTRQIDWTKGVNNG